MAAMRQRGDDTAAAIAERADDFTVPLDDALSLLVSLWVPVVGALVAELPGIIARAAANLGLAVPMPQGPQRPDQLRGIWRLEAATRPARLDPIWPMFPAISPYFSGAAAGPGRLGAPVKTFIQVTKTEGLTDRGYRAIPPLDPALCAVLGVKVVPVFGVRVKPGLSDHCPTPKDQLTAKLTDRAHRCMMQQEAVMNNIARASPSLPLRRQPHLAFRPRPPPSQAAASGQQRPRAAGSWGDVPPHKRRLLRGEGEACDSEKHLFTRDGCLFPTKLTLEPTGPAITFTRIPPHT
ncbi:unnamed protein product [Boreogadus saida]